MMPIGRLADMGRLLHTIVGLSGRSKFSQPLGLLGCRRESLHAAPSGALPDLTLQHLRLPQLALATREQQQQLAGRKNCHAVDAMRCARRDLRNTPRGFSCSTTRQLQPEATSVSGQTEQHQTARRQTVAEYKVPVGSEMNVRMYDTCADILVTKDGYDTVKIQVWSSTARLQALAHVHASLERGINRAKNSSK